MTPQEILSHVRELIRQHAGDDADKWWYANRFVFARLNLDERKTKTSIKQRLLESARPCHACGESFESRRNIHLHRLDGDRGYSKANCVLMHADCHTKHHAGDRAKEPTPMTHEPVLTKWSKAYDDKPFTYWWDITPSLAGSIDYLEAVEFARKDSRERCTVPIPVLKAFLTPDRQTTRGYLDENGRGHWGIKVLKDRPDELAFEPGHGQDKWLFLPVVWCNDETED